MRFRGWAALAVMLAVAFPVQAQVVQQDGSRTDPGRRGTGGAMLVGGISRTDTTMGILTTDDSGNLYTREVNPDRSQIYYATDIINRQAPCALWPPNSVGTACMTTMDSSAAINTTGWSHMTLWIYPRCTGATTTGDCDSLGFVYLALQVRGSAYNASDSLTARPRLGLRRATALGGRDTLGGFNGFYATGGIGGSAGSVIQDSLQTRADPYTEQMILVPVAPEIIQGGRGYAVTLVDPSTGEPWAANYTSIRIRYIAGYKVDRTATQLRWGTTQPMPINIRADLEGWR